MGPGVDLRGLFGDILGALKSTVDVLLKPQELVSLFQLFLQYLYEVYGL